MVHLGDRVPDRRRWPPVGELAAVRAAGDGDDAAVRCARRRTCVPYRFRLPTLHDPLWDIDAFTRCSDDRYFLLIEADGPGPEVAAIHVSLANAAARSIHELRSEEHTSELQSLMRISYAVFCLKKKK